MYRFAPWLIPLVLACLVGCGDDDVAGLADAGTEELPPAIGQFPDDFLWGTAIAPYQVEGGLHQSDWYQWEDHCGGHCSEDSADDGPDFLVHYADDFDAAVSLSNNAIRLGISWSRLFPTAESFPDSPDPEAVQLYHDILDAARERGLEPMVTLVHFTLPTWIHDLDDRKARPGWEDPAIPELFAEFATWAADEYGSKVDLWITLNEPFVLLVGGWVAAAMPPGLDFDIDAALVAGHNMITAHARGYDAIHLVDVVDADGDDKPARVSISQHSRVFMAKNPDNPRQVRAVEMFRYLLNDYFLNAVVYGNLDMNYDFDVEDPDDVVGDPDLEGRLDFVGLNYYGPTVVVETANDDLFPLIGIPFINDLDLQGLEEPITDFGWSIYPAGFRQVIEETAEYGLPIIVTENGLADAGDTLRPRFLVEHLYELGAAMDDGIDIDGYFHWSLMDNFEWSSGYCPRFGLLRVDFDHPDKPRTVGAGAQMYKQIIDAKTVEPELFGEVSYGAPGHCPRVGL